MSPLTIDAHGRSYKINDPGGLIGSCLRSGQPYETKVLEYIQRLGLRGLAVDVGAGVGNHSLWLAAICGLEVYAFEPIDFVRLQENLELNPSLLITPSSNALGDETKVDHVRGAPKHVIGESFPDDGVQIRKLDDVVNRPVCMIKIDVEGMEPQVLRGAEQTINAYRPVIFAEAETPEAGERNAEILRGWGYKKYHTFGATPLEEWQP